MSNVALPSSRSLHSIGCPHKTMGYLSKYMEKDVFCTKSMTKLEAATVTEKYRNHIFLSDYRTFYISRLRQTFDN